jgi:hypothetical protein
MKWLRQRFVAQLCDSLCANDALAVKIAAFMLHHPVGPFTGPPFDVSAFYPTVKYETPTRIIY